MDRPAKISLCVTEEDLLALETMRRRLGLNGAWHNQSEIVRAAIAHLKSAEDGVLLAALLNISKLKPGPRSKRSPRGTPSGEASLAVDQ